MEDTTTICQCNQVTFGTIKEAVKNGCYDVPCVMLKTGAGDACGQCKSLNDDPKMRRQYHIKEDVLER